MAALRTIRARLMADVTVVIPTYNRRMLLARTLHSVLAQREVALAVVVVDDGGSDGTASAVAALADSRVTVVRHPKPRGVSAARNRGIEQATTPWLAFVDDDDLWAPGKVRAQLDALAADPSARWSCTGSVNIDSRCQVSRWDELPRDVSLADLLLSQNVVPGGGSGVLVSRELTTEVGGFDEALSNLADWDFYIRLALQSAVAAVYRPHLGYYVHPQGMAHDVDRSAREYRYLDVKYGTERKRRGVMLNTEEWLAYLAGLAYNGGRRLTGMRLHAQLVTRHHRLRSLRSIGMGLAPERLRLARARRPGPPPPLGWAEETDTWLAPYVRGWLE
jgi:glycosyltransferase involved in cell wall biosynthesis